MSPAGYRPPRPARRIRTASMAGRSAAGQVLAMFIVLLIGLPLLPLILLIIVWIRLRDRSTARTGRQDADPVTATSSRSAIHAAI